MKILLLAPHPFFQERGTPIDVLLVLRVLSELTNTQVDVLTYHEGEDVHLPDVIIHRIKVFGLIRKIRPGFSLKKLICDVFMFFEAWSLVRRGRYDFIHAGEEAVFFAIFFKWMYKIPYAYDLDSSIAQQLVEKKPYLKILSPLFNWLEGKAIQKSIINFPVCNALAELCERNGANKTVTLHDISQLENANSPSTGLLRRELKIGSNTLILLYIGNLEVYQGVDLMLDSFHLVCKRTDNIELVIVGGVDEDIKRYSNKAQSLGIDEKTHFLGPKPFRELDQYLAEADMLACPRIRGINTPMKIFPYLHSGKPVIATDIYTHNQILTNNEAYLATPDPEGFSKGVITLASDEGLREKLGKRGQEFVEKGHVYSAHRERLSGAYDWVKSVINQ